MNEIQRYVKKLNLNKFWTTILKQFDIGKELRLS